MRYLLTISADESLDSTRTDEERNRIYAAYMEYTQAMKAAGVHLGGEALQPTATGSRIQVRDGKASVTDGPFTETKEVLGGYYLLEVASKEEAIEWAKRCPDAESGTIEVRPIWEFG